MNLNTNLIFFLILFFRRVLIRSFTLFPALFPKFLLLSHFLYANMQEMNLFLF